MSGRVRIVGPDDAVRLVGQAARRARGAFTVLVDGPSGSGKSDLSAAIVAAWPGTTQLLRLDDVYPGWTGLDAAARIVARRVLAPRARGLAGRVPEWDWSASRPRPERSLTPSRSLVVDGCASFGLRHVSVRVLPAPATLRIWVEAPYSLRRPRAIARDGGGYEEFWELWDTQWRRYVVRDRPRERADIEVEVG